MRKTEKHSSFRLTLILPTSLKPECQVRFMYVAFSVPMPSHAGYYTEAACFFSRSPGSPAKIYHQIPTASWSTVFHDVIRSFITANKPPTTTPKPSTSSENNKHWHYVHGVHLLAAPLRVESATWSTETANPRAIL